MMKKLILCSMVMAMFFVMDAGAATAPAKATDAVVPAVSCTLSVFGMCLATEPVQAGDPVRMCKRPGGGQVICPRPL